MTKKCFSIQVFNSCLSYYNPNHSDYSEAETKSVDDCSLDRGSTYLTFIVLAVCPHSGIINMKILVSYLQ